MNNIHIYLPLILLKTLFFNAYGEYQYITVEGTHTSTIPASLSSNAIEEGSQYRISFELDLNTVGEALVGDDADFGQNFLGYDYVFKNSVKNFSYTSAFSTLESSSDLNLYLKIDSTNRIRVGIFYYPQAISIHGGVLSTIGLKGEKSDAPLSAYVLGDSLNDYFTASNFNFVSIFHDTYAYWTTAFLNTAGSTAYFNTMPIDSIYEGTIATELPTIQLEASYVLNQSNSYSLIIDATPISGYPEDFTYQWYVNDFPIPASFGGQSSTIEINSNNQPLTPYGVNVTNSTGTTTRFFNVYLDLDNDGLNDYFETNTNVFVSPENTGTSPLQPDSSGDGLLDGVVVNAGFDPNTDYSSLVSASRQGMSDLRPGSTMIEVTNNEATIQLKMEESTDLNSWTEINGAATMTVPVPSGSDTKFFRFKMAE